MSVEVKASREIPIKDLDIFTTDWVFRRKSIGDDAFVALMASDLGLRVIAVVKDGPRELETVREKIGPSDRGLLSHWIVLTQNLIEFSRPHAPLTVYGNAGPMSLTGMKLVSLKPEETPEVTKAVLNLIRSGVNFVHALGKGA